MSQEVFTVDSLRAARVTIETARDEDLSESNLLRVLANAVLIGAHVKNRFHDMYRHDYRHEPTIASVARAVAILHEEGTKGLAPASVELARAVERLIPLPGLASAVRTLNAVSSPMDIVLSELHDKIVDWLDATIELVHFNDIIDEG